MVTLDAAAVRAACAAYPKPADFKPSYGTAGFRAEASLLPSTVFRCGMLIGLRANSAGQVRLLTCSAAEAPLVPVLGASSGWMGVTTVPPLPCKSLKPSHLLPALLTTRAVILCSTSAIDNHFSASQH